VTVEARATMRAELALGRND